MSCQPSSHIRIFIPQLHAAWEASPHLVPEDSPGANYSVTIDRRTLNVNTKQKIGVCSIQKLCS